MNGRLLLLVALLGGALVAGCGDDEQPAQAPAGASADLSVRVTGTGSGPIAVDYRCGAGRPCEPERLDALTELAAPPDPARACTEIYGGPERAHVTGTIRGEPVDVTVARNDGCGIADYEALFAALGRRQPLAP
jgi:hypothetical protein